MKHSIFVEACIDSVEAALAVKAAGARRVELCSALFEGGLTPSAGMVKTVKAQSGMDVMVMIRPRGGDFCYSDAEFEVMKEDVRALKGLGVTGMVFGILEKDGRIDERRSRELIELIRPLKVTFHRAFDVTPDAFEALETLISLGVDRVLTSGQEGTVWEGVELIAELNKRAAGRIIVMPGGGISERNFAKIHEKLDFAEYHIGLPVWKESVMEFRRDYVPMGGSLYPPEYGVRAYDGDALGRMITR